ncbi:MAG: hypothetical protein ACOH2V_14665 [Candidatus Saccharimonadaceae bacterium]
MEYLEQNELFTQLIEGLHPGGCYEHLMVILNRNDSNQSLGQKYLMVTRTDFGIVKLIDIDFRETYILMDLEDVLSGVIQQFKVAIDQTEFQFLLVNWDDVSKMVDDEMIRNADTISKS